MANKREKISIPRKKQKLSIFETHATFLKVLKIIIIYFCLPFTIALLCALFITAPRPGLSPEIADWRDSGYVYRYHGLEIFYQGSLRLINFIVYKSIWNDFLKQVICLVSTSACYEQIALNVLEVKCAHKEQVNSFYSVGTTVCFGEKIC